MATAASFGAVATPTLADVAQLLRRVEVRYPTLRPCSATVTARTNRDSDNDSHSTGRSDITADIIDACQQSHSGPHSSPSQRLVALVDAYHRAPASCFLDDDALITEFTSNDNLVNNIELLHYLHCQQLVRIETVIAALYRSGDRRWKSWVNVLRRMVESVGVTVTVAGQPSAVVAISSVVMHLHQLSLAAITASDTPADSVSRIALTAIQQLCYPSPSSSPAAPHSLAILVLSLISGLRPCHCHMAFYRHHCAAFLQQPALSKSIIDSVSLWLINVISSQKTLGTFGSQKTSGTSEMLYFDITDSIRLALVAEEQDAVVVPCNLQPFVATLLSTAASRQIQLLTLIQALFAMISGALSLAFATPRPAVVARLLLAVRLLVDIQSQHSKPWSSHCSSLLAMHYSIPRDYIAWWKREVEKVILFESDARGERRPVELHFQRKKRPKWTPRAKPAGSENGNLAASAAAVLALDDDAVLALDIDPDSLTAAASPYKSSTRKRVASRTPSEKFHTELAQRLHEHTCQKSRERHLLTLLAALELTLDTDEQYVCSFYAKVLPSYFVAGSDSLAVIEVEMRWKSYSAALRKRIQKLTRQTVSDEVLFC